MKRLAYGVAVLLAAAMLSFGGPPPANTYSGQIMDAMCAANGSHSPAGYKATKTNNPKDCTLACVKAGSKFVLYYSKRSTRQLDDQATARQFAGQKVKVTGAYDRATKTIHVTKIEPAA